jgi:UDP-GlcNAc:undecaprenyl-phosphate/decaprenyl-phosphate GlcNAc-1-phosphate transferase
MSIDWFTNTLLLVFSVAFMGCVLSTPLVTRIAVWAGAIDRPDQFRRVHSGATPRLGGLGLAFGFALSIVLVTWGGYLRQWDDFPTWWSKQHSILIAALIVLAVGTVDDARGMRPRLKLLGQTAASLVLFLGGIQIKRIAILGSMIELGSPRIPFLAVGDPEGMGWPSLLVTMFWFLGCINIWNLIDGMDGLASGVALLVSGTLMLIGIHQDNTGAAIMAAGLAGSLAGFLLYNWHPACIFLGDSGSMLIGLLVGVIGVEYSLKKTSTVSVLFPILAMGLPISDTAMAIFRRWVRNLPLTAADRRHVHHLLMGLGLNPRQAALLLYCFSAGLCGVVLLGVAYQKEFLALVVGISGCLAFLLILMSRRDELASLCAELKARFERRRQERYASRVTWEAIQKTELAERIEGISTVLMETSQSFGCDSLQVACHRDGREVFRSASRSFAPNNSPGPMSGPTAMFRLTSGRDLLLTVELHQSADSRLAADIAFRFLQRLSLATAERLERLLGEPPSEDSELAAVALNAAPAVDMEPLETSIPPAARVAALTAGSSAWDPFGWFRLALGGENAAQAGRTTSIGED